MHIRKTAVVVAIFVLAGFFIAPYLMLLGPVKLREYVHKQIVYKAIAVNFTGRESAFSDTEKAERLFYFVQTHVFEPNGEGGPDKHSLDNLVRGHGSCDQQANALIHLAGKLGIKGRLLFLQGAPHSVCDLYLEGKYRIFDPYFGIILKDSGNEIATFEDIRYRFDDFFSLQLTGLQKLTGLERETYYRYFSKDHVVFHTNFESGKLRNIINAAIDIHFNLFGRQFVSLSQDLFFAAEGTPAYLRARYQHLAGRYDEAIASYEQLLEKETEATDSHERLMYFIGQALWDKNDYQATVSWFENFLKLYPDTRFSSGVYTYLGDSYLKLNEVDKARTVLSNCKDLQSPVPMMIEMIDLSAEKLKQF